MIYHWGCGTYTLLGTCAEYLGTVILNKGYEDMDDKIRVVGDINDTKQEKPDFA